MTEEALRNAIIEAYCAEIARRVSEKLLEMQKKALVVCTGSTMGFSQWLVSLQQLQQAGFCFDLYLSQNAVQILDLTVLKSAVKFGTIWTGDSEQPPEVVAAPYPTILVPAMTVNTAAKIAACTADTPAARVIFNSMMRGKNVVVVTDGCCPDHEARVAKGYHIPEPLKVQLRNNLVKLQEYGATLTSAEKLCSKTLKVIGESVVPLQPASQSVKSSTSATPRSTVASATIVDITRRIIGRQDVAMLPSGSVLRVPRGCQITQMAMDTARAKGVTVVRE